MKNVKTLLIDKNKLFREGMKRLLGETRFEVVADLSDMNEVEAWARENGKAGTCGSRLFVADSLEG